MYWRRWLISWTTAIGAEQRRDSIDKLIHRKVRHTRCGKREEVGEVEEEAAQQRRASILMASSHEARDRCSRPRQPPPPRPKNQHGRRARVRREGPMPAKSDPDPACGPLSRSGQRWPPLFGDRDVIFTTNQVPAKGESHHAWRRPREDPARLSETAHWWSP